MNTVVHLSNIALVWFSIAFVVLFMSLAFAVYQSKVAGNPVVLGMMAVPVSCITAVGWWPNIDNAWVGLVPTLTMIAFAIGFTRPDHLDDDWYYVAVAIAIFGKPIIAAVPWFGNLLSSGYRLNGWVIFGIIIAFIAFVAYRRRKKLNQVYRDYRTKRKLEYEQNAHGPTIN